MTIGVFGDSFARPGFGHRDRAFESLAWVNNLGQQAVSHAHEGTSVLWSYQLFLKHHEKYDQIVFVASDPTRFDHKGTVFPSGKPYFIHSLNSVQQILKEGPWARGNLKNWTKNMEWDLHRVRALRDYFLYLQDDEVDHLYLELMLRDIKTRRPDAVIIPGFSPCPGLTTCQQYLDLQIRSYYRPERREDIWHKFAEIRTSCHFTQEINLLVADHVDQALKGAGWQDWGVDQMRPITHNQPWDYYYEALDLVDEKK